MADVVGTLVGLVVVSGVGALVGIVVNALIVLLITLLMAGNGTLFPICESASGYRTLFLETELCFLFCESESDLLAGSGTCCASDIALVIR